jgi:hypothetical protein
LIALECAGNRRTRQQTMHDRTRGLRRQAKSCRRVRS